MDRQLLTYLTNHAAILVFHLDSRGLIVGANSRARKLTGLDPVGKDFREVLVDFSGSFTLDDALADEKPRLLNFITSGGLPQTYTVRFTPADDGILAIGELDQDEIEDLRKSMLRLNNEMANLTRELQKKNIELNKLNELKNHFLGMAAHDLRSPLSIVETYSDFLTEELSSQLGEEHLNFLTIIKSTSSFMRGLIDNLLDISMIESGKLDLDRSVQDPCMLIRKNIGLNAVLAARKQIAIALDVRNAIPELSLDADRIIQVMNNLISNAVKFSPQGGAVAVTISHEGGRVTVSVSDNGPGIPREEQRKLFQPFGRTSVKAAGGEKSTGLGLLIARKIINAHGGEMSLESEPGRGSVFSFSLPVRHNEHAGGTQ